MHHIRWEIKEYRKDTSHLTLLEHGIYRQLLDTYYIEEQPLCADKAKLMRTHCVRSAEEMQAFDNVLNDFFLLSDDGYRHAKCDEILAKIYAKSEKARQSAEARWLKNNNKSEKDAKPMRTQCEGNATHEPKNPRTQEPKNPKDGDKSPSSKNMAFEIFVFWCDTFKKSTTTSKLTDKRLKAINARIKEGYTVEQIKQAIVGCSLTPHNMGKNDNGKKYICLSLICRSGDQIERFIDNAETTAPQQLTGFDALTGQNDFIEGHVIDHEGEPDDT